jgi:hypothetical protein
VLVSVGSLRTRAVSNQRQPSRLSNLIHRVHKSPRKDVGRSTAGQHVRVAPWRLPFRWFHADDSAPSIPAAFAPAQTMVVVSPGKLSHPALFAVLWAQAKRSPPGRP